MVEYIARQCHTGMSHGGCLCGTASLYNPKLNAIFHGATYDIVIIIRVILSLSHVYQSHSVTLTCVDRVTWTLSHMTAVTLGHVHLTLGFPDFGVPCCLGSRLQHCVNRGCVWSMSEV